MIVEWEECGGGSPFHATCSSKCAVEVGSEPSEQTTHPLLVRCCAPERV